MANYVELTPEELHTATSQEVQEAANAEDRIPGGKYLAKTTKVLRKRINDDAEFNAGRSLATLAVTLYSPEYPTIAVGNQFIDISWEPRYRTDGKLDASARRYVEVQKALGQQRAGVPEVLAAVQQQLFSVKVRETFRVDASDLLPIHTNAKVGSDGMAWVNVPEGDDGIEVYDHYSDLGYDSRVMIDRIFKAS